MTETTTTSISKFASSFLSGKNLGKEANFLPERVGNCISLAVEDVLFALVRQLLLHGKSNYNLVLEICILSHSRAGCLRRNVLHIYSSVLGNVSLFLGNVA